MVGQQNSLLLPKHYQQEEIEQAKICKLSVLAQGCGSQIVKISENQVIKLILHQGGAQHKRACKILLNDFKISRNFNNRHLIFYEEHVLCGQFGCQIEYQQNENNQQYQQNTKGNQQSQQGQFYCSVKMKKYECDLFDYFIGREQREKKEILQAIRDIVEGLDEMHEKGFAHNDIKPENILVEKISEMEKNFVLADFGCAMKQSEIKQLKQQIGNWQNRELSYCGPEIHEILFSDEESKNKLQIVDERMNDIFSLGQTIYMIVFKQFPRKSKVPDEKCPLYKYIINQQPEALYYEYKKNFELPQGWSEEELIQIVQIVCQMMQPRPQERINCKQILEMPLLKIQK